MNFSGYVQLRRGLMEHTYDGRLSNNEALALVWLIMLADKKTGRGTINGPTLRMFLPGFSKHESVRILASLEEKGYIFRDIIPRSPLVYPYWVDGYKPTVGKHKGRQLFIAEALRNKDVSLIRYVDPATDTLEATPTDTLEATPTESVNYNNTREVRSKKRDERLSLLVKESLPPILQPGASLVSTEQFASGHPVDRPSVRPAASQAVAQAVAQAAPGAAVQPVSQSASSSGAGLRWSGVDGTFVDIITGFELPAALVDKRLRTVGLVLRQSKFFRIDNDEPVGWDEAQRIIAGDRAA